MSTWILLRGLAREARHWGRVLPLLQQRVPPGDRVLALDLPGNGARWRERTPASVGGMVEALRRCAGGAGERQPRMLVALSLGGMVALEWAARHPEEVRGCVLVNSSAGGLAPFWQRLRPRSYAALLRLLLPAPPRVREAAVLALTSNLPAPPVLLEAWTRYAEEAPLARANVLRQLLAAARFRPPPPGPWVPTLLLASAQDRLVAPACSRAMARAWSAPLREHPFAGHDLALDDPEWLVEQVVGWQAGLASCQCSTIR